MIMVNKDYQNGTAYQWCRVLQTTYRSRMWPSRTNQLNDRSIWRPTATLNEINFKPAHRFSLMTWWRRYQDTTDDRESLIYPSHTHNEANIRYYGTNDNLAPVY